MLVGKPAPDFAMVTNRDPNTLDHMARLEDYRGRWLVLFFYPADFTFVCPTEMLAFSAAAPRFAELDAELLAVSTDGVHSHVAWTEFHIGNLAFDLASDRNHRASVAYSVLDAETGEAARGIFIVDPEGVIRYEVVHDEPVGRNVNEVLRVLAALQKPGKTFAQWDAEVPVAVN
jgi:peroxiredoxin (alkyl hydroperoxide reductase subunit C)